MDKTYDFSNDRIVLRSLGGSDRKNRVLHDGKYYMLKFTEEHVKKSEVSTSHENNAISEYISSHIAQSTGLETHNTILGFYNDEVCVACEDFRTSDTDNMEFQEIMRTIYGPSELKRIARLDQIYAAYNCPAFPEYLREDGVKRYWDTFVIDALVGNFDRHIGNWGLLTKADDLNGYKLAPTYDYGSTLFPILSDDGVKEIIDNEFEMQKRCYVFPSATLYLTKEKKGKPGYYDMLASGYDENCSTAIIRMFPKINIEKIDNIIDNTPIISDVKKDFYKKILDMRYELILEKAYQHCINHDYDKDALNRLQNGISIDDKMLSEIMQEKPASMHLIKRPHQSKQDKINESLTHDETMQNIADNSKTKADCEDTKSTT